MAEQNSSSHVSEAPVIITTSSEVVKSDVDHSNAISSSCDSRIFSEKKCTSSDEVCNNVSQSHGPNSALVYHNSAISSTSENSNGVSDLSDKSKSNSFLRPSALSTKTDSLKCPLKSPKLNLTASKLGDSPSPSSSAKSPYMQAKNPFSSTASFANLSESPPSNQSKDANPMKLVLGTFSNPSTTNSLGTSLATSSPVSVPNFVFGQNLHERVTENVKVFTKNDKSGEATTSNGTSDMLFTSALTNKDVSKENLTSENSSNSKEASSLEEDAARCQEARAMKRKYEEVLVTTGEEEEENILQVNVKLFAFDNGTWVERGRGTLRLNDKNCDGVTRSRIVIRTVGSLRVVLNTKIWSGMTLSKASERSIRLTALDPNGQLKIFLIQASPKDMTTLYRHLEFRVKKCQERDLENKESPEKKIALDVHNKT